MRASLASDLTTHQKAAALAAWALTPDRRRPRASPRSSWTTHRSTRSRSPGWFELARIVRELGEDPAVRVVVLRAEGRGFNAGVDIKEMQATEGFDALIGANRGCYAAFAAVYECAVPVIAAVNGFCLGGGIGLVGNADIVIVASDDATFGLPEVDRGALGAATHLARLVPQHRMRAMVYTAATATAAELHHFGSVLRVVPLDGAARRGVRGRRPRSRRRARRSSAPPRSRSTASTRST